MRFEIVDTIFHVSKYKKCRYFASGRRNCRYRLAAYGSNNEREKTADSTARFSFFVLILVLRNEFLRNTA